MERRPDHSSEIKISLRERGQVCIYRLPTASRREEDPFPCRLSVDIDTCGLVISLYSGRLSVDIVTCGLVIPLYSGRLSVDMVICGLVISLDSGRLSVDMVTSLVISLSRGRSFLLTKLLVVIC